MICKITTIVVLMFAVQLAAAELPRDNLDDTGFVSIFDGQTLDGWHISAETGHSSPSGHKSGGRWVVEGGAIVGSQDTPANGGIIITDKPFGDFEVIIEMNNEFGPDSGLFLRSTEKGQAYQYMIDYHQSGNLAGLFGEGLSGEIAVQNFSFRDCPDVIVPVAQHPIQITPEQWPQLWKHGQWNELRARIVGNPPKITTWINRVRFIEWKDTEPRHAAQGGIALQVHGGGDFTKQFVRYRAIRVKELHE